MLKNDKIEEINSLIKEDFSISTISQKVQVSLPTVYKYLKKNNISGIVSKNNSFLLEFQNYIKKRKREGVTNKFKIYSEISNLGYKCYYPTPGV